MTLYPLPSFNVTPLTWMSWLITPVATFPFVKKQLPLPAQFWVPDPVSTMQGPRLLGSLLVHLVAAVGDIFDMYILAMLYDVMPRFLSGMFKLGLVQFLD